jgi:excinuclease ABC subunit A
VSTSIDSVSSPSIIVRGARTHNLKNIDLDLPQKRLIAVTGVSGSGKSSLAFDTLYAEGQRRYVETFSPYARQFLARLDKPPAELIAGIPPAIAVGTTRGRPSHRSTVGTMTEIHDALALLFTSAGVVTCFRCGHAVAPASPAAVARAIDALPEGSRYEIAFPIDVRARTDQDALFSSLRSEGFTRLRVDGELVTIGTAAPTFGLESVIEGLVDRLVRGKDPPERRMDSVETAFARGLGRCRLIADGQVETFVRGWRCGQCGTDHLEPRPALFHYNSAYGACPRCEGLGQTMELELARLVPDPTKTVRGGAIAPLAAAAYQRFQHALLAAAPALGVPVDVPFRSLSADQVRVLTDGVPGSGFRGLKGFFQRLERRAGEPRVRLFLGRWQRYEVCPDCHGARLGREALAVKIDGRDMASLSAQTIGEARGWLSGLGAVRSLGRAAVILAGIEGRLAFLTEIGLDYLTLDRPVRSLSSGELKRVELTKALGSGLVNTLYVLDEPTTGLHPSESARMVGILHRLRDRGNSLVVVEHDHDVILGSDHVVDLGPGAGGAGGKVVYSGPTAGLLKIEGSATAEYLSGRKGQRASSARRAPTGRAIHLSGAAANNLKSIDVTFPLGVLCVVTGLSGSGKSTLIAETLYPALRHHLAQEPAGGALYRELTLTAPVADVAFLDQSALALSPRSNPATSVRAFDEIRKTFAATHEARLRNYDAGRFSYNVEGGRCNACQGNGYVTIDMQFLPDVMIRCSECQGTRYRPEILEVAYRGKNIAEVLDMTAREAFSFFRNRPRIQARLRALNDIGLDYLRLGQPLRALSGGEAQRLKLAGFLARSRVALNRPGVPEHSILLLDEPAAGLHPLDIEKLLEVLNSLVDRGHSVIAIEHSPEVMLAADWIIDLGPGAGAEGGRVAAQGTPEAVALARSPTGRIVARAIAGQAIS